MSMNTNMIEAIDIAIVGLGSRGLGVLERVLKLATCIPDTQINVVSFDKNEPGSGLHSSTQPEYLRLNTIACELSMFPDESAIQSLGARKGPNFYQWCVQQGVTANDVHNPNAELNQTDFLPRYLLGQYLEWVYRSITSQLADNVTLIHEFTSIDKIEADSKKNVYTLSTQSNKLYCFNRVFVCLGHTHRNTPEQPANTTISNDNNSSRVNQKGVANSTRPPYPIADTIANIHPTESVAIAGLGLAAMDVLSGLTLGNGGVFEYVGSNLSYLPSGNEPEIVMYSRTGLPFFTRPAMFVGRKKHRAIFLTSEHIEFLRQEKLEGKLDFKNDILPLMLDEMRAAYYIHCDTLEKSNKNIPFDRLREKLSLSFKNHNLVTHFLELAKLHGGFDPQAYLMVAIPESIQSDQYQNWVMRTLSNDLKESELGLMDSPSKSAIEVWRDLRETLRDIVNYDGLTRDSHEWFYSHFSKLINRIVAGPQKERHAELLALIEAGTVTMIAPQQAVDFDHIIAAQTADSGLINSQSRVLSDLLEMNIIEPVQNNVGLDGIAVDRNSNPKTQVQKNQQLTKRIWFFGPLCEGSSYYNHYVPSSGGGYSRAMAEAHNAVMQCYGISDDQLHNVFSSKDTHENTILKATA
ncbi:MAG: putative NAD(P)/FAD-binding protein YdhS [Arenicella sp.]|jgi:uncharacterized NAD(P)/FAD-binding protein YdhS